MNFIIAQLIISYVLQDHDRIYFKLLFNDKIKRRKDSEINHIHTYM